MSQTRRNLSAKFKSELVIELRKGEKDFMKFQTPGQKRQVLFLYQSVLQYVHSSLLLCTAAV